MRSFQQKLREYWALYRFSRGLSDRHIDVTMRSFYKKNRACFIPRVSPCIELPERFSTSALPDSYYYKGQCFSLEGLLRDTQTTGFAVWHDDALICERYFRGNSRESQVMWMSVSKSMASLITGMVHESGALSDLHRPVTDYAPVLTGSAYDGVSINNVLEMSSGVRWVEDFGDLKSELVQSIVASQTASLDEFTASVPREYTPGTYNRYASIDTHALGMVLRGATGRPYTALFSDLWAQIGAEDDAWMLTDATGEALAYGGVNARLRDMLRFAKVYLQKGCNDAGKPLVSEQWIKHSTTPDCPRLMPMKNNPESENHYGYKYHWWIPPEPDGGDFVALGAFGQLLYISPGRGVIIAKSSAYKNYAVDGEEMFDETLAAFQAVAKYLDGEC